MSVQSDTLGYAEACEKSHEFLRRGCTYTPEIVSWAGDLLVLRNFILKQSEVNDIRGEESDVTYEYDGLNEDCDDTEVAIPSQYKVEETDIRTGDANTFEYTVPKNPIPDNEVNWDIGILQSNNECGEMFDGGDILQEYDLASRVVSICGTIDRTGGVADSAAHYLDNRNSYSSDPDNGLLVCIRTGLEWSWEIRYAPKTLDLSTGLSASDDVTLVFREAVNALGMTDKDVIEFGMI